MAAAASASAFAEFSCQTFDTLKRDPKEDAQVLELLKRAAWQVQPIMKRRSWRVLLLKELEPENMTRGGDNLNRGQQVRIKVRRPGGGFYDYDHVLLVLLHELCHCQHGPHSADFYKLLDDITLECEELAAKKQGGTGAGFDAAGQKLGHRGGWGVAPSDPKTAAREAALKRAAHQSVMGGGGRLGGGPAAGLTPQQAAAAAAQRRAVAQEFSRRAGLEHDEEPEASGAPSARPSAAPSRPAPALLPAKRPATAAAAPRQPAAPPPPKLTLTRPPCFCGEDHGTSREAVAACKRSRGTADAPIIL